MAFDIVFYVNDSDNNKLNKDLREVITVSGTLKEGSSIITPTILIETNLIIKQ